MSHNHKAYMLFFRLSSIPLNTLDTDIQQRRLWVKGGPAGLGRLLPNPELDTELHIGKRAKHSPSGRYQRRQKLRACQSE